MEGLKMAQGESAVGMEVRVQTASSVLSDANKLNNSLSHPHWWGVQGVSQLQHTAIGVFLVGFTVTATVSNILVVSTCLGWVQGPERDIYIYRCYDFLVSWLMLHYYQFLLQLHYLQFYGWGKCQFICQILFMLLLSSVKVRVHSEVLILMMILFIWSHNFF